MCVCVFVCVLCACRCPAAVCPAWLKSSEKTMANRDEASLCWELTQPKDLRMVNMACTRSTADRGDESAVCECESVNAKLCSCSTHRWSSLLWYQLVWGERVWRPGTPWSYQSHCVPMHTHSGLFCCRPWTRTHVWPEQPEQEERPTTTPLAETSESKRTNEKMLCSSNEV